MKLRAFCWAFLISFLIDAILALTSTLDPSVEKISNSFSYMVAILSSAIFILTLRGRIKPKSLFLILSTFYLMLVFFGICLGIALLTKIEINNNLQAVSYELIAEQFAWYPTLHWIIIVSSLSLGVYGIYSYIEFNHQISK